MISCVKAEFLFAARKDKRFQDLARIRERGISFNFHVALKVSYQYLWHINEIFATRVEIGQCLLMKEFDSLLNG